MYKTILALISFGFLTMQAYAGPTVSGGIAYHQDLEKCINKKQKVFLSIEANVTPQMIGGYMQEGSSNYALNCVEGKNQQSPITGEEIIWSCFENRAGEGQMRIHINRKSNGLKYGVVYRDDIIGRLSEMYQLKCDQQVSH